MLCASDRQISMRALVMRILALSMMVIGGLLIMFTLAWTAYLATLDWPDNSWPGWQFFAEGDALYCAAWLALIALGWWLSRRFRRNASAAGADLAS
jgi:hypothetical protein